MAEFQVSLSHIDKERFGIQTAKAHGITTSEHLKQLDSFCRDNAVKLSIARVNSTHLNLVQEMQFEGYYLMDTLLYYVRDMKKKPIEPSEAPVLVRDAIDSDIDAIGEVAAAAFHNYQGHYHADSHLSNDKCDEVYIDWAKSSLHNSALAQMVKVAELDGKVVSFVSSRMNSAEDGEVVLSGVLPEARRRGIYQHFLELGTYWCQEQGAHRVWFTTQITNTAVQKVYIRLGFHLVYSEYTLHKWFE